VKGKLPGYMVPSQYVVMGELPLTPNGKLDKKALPAPDAIFPDRHHSIAPPRDDLERGLVHIWEKVLQARPIGIRDDFFELGGNSLLALRMLGLVQQQYAKGVAMSTIFKARTIQSLAGILRRKAPSLTESPLVAIQPHGNNPKLFCVHPGSGNVFCYADLARRLGPDQPLYGLQDPSIYTDTTPAIPIEVMAARYIEALRSAQSEGPYLLAGWSFGGFVAFEIARQLFKARQEVLLLALLDTSAPNSTRQFSHVADDAFLLYVIASEIGLQVSPDELRQLQPDERISHLNRLMQKAEVLLYDDGAYYLRRQLEIFKARMRAVDDYRPGIYPGQITLFKANDREGESLPMMGLSDPTAGWTELSTQPVETLCVSGTHTTLAREPHVETLAKLLSGCIEKALTKMASY
jgi:thioesterase domain-containing protein